MVALVHDRGRTSTYVAQHGSAAVHLLRLEGTTGPGPFPVAAGDVVKQGSANPDTQVERANPRLKPRILAQARHQSTEWPLGHPQFDEVIECALGDAHGDGGELESQSTERRHRVERVSDLRRCP